MASKRTVVRSTNVQLRLLVEYMSANKLFALGEYTGPIGAQRAEAEWAKLRNFLSENGPSKTVAQWKHTWRDLKKKSRDEAARARVARGVTGNHILVPKVSDMTEKILEIIGRESAVGVSVEGESQVGEFIDLPDSKFSWRTPSPFPDADAEDTTSKPLLSLTPEPSPRPTLGLSPLFTPSYSPRHALGFMPRPASDSSPRATPSSLPHTTVASWPRPTPGPSSRPAPRPSLCPAPSPSPRPAPRPSPCPAPSPSPRPGSSTSPRPAPGPSPRAIMGPSPSPRPTPGPSPRAIMGPSLRLTSIPSPRFVIRAGAARPPPPPPQAAVAPQQAPVHERARARRRPARALQSATKPMTDFLAQQTQQILHLQELVAEEKMRNKLLEMKMKHDLHLEQMKMTLHLHSEHRRRRTALRNLRF